MRSRKRTISRCSVAHSTGHAVRYAKDYQDMVDNFRGDSSIKERVDAGKCKACFYFFKARVGGTVMTSQECGLCDDDMMFGSTATDPLCLSCAKENGLCKQCGGDIDMKNRRKPYPFQKVELLPVKLD